MQSTETSGKSSETPTTIRLGFVPGVIPAKWVRIWRERHPNWDLELVALPSLDRGYGAKAGEVDLALVRPPLISRDLHAVLLYEEVPVVVFPKDHHFAAADSLTAADLASEIQLDPLDSPFSWRDREGNSTLPGRPAKERPEDTEGAVALVAAGIGVLVVPQSLARLHHRKDLTYLPLAGGATTPIALVWRQDDARDLVEEFHGIVRGRTENSSRGPGNQPLEGKAAKAAKAQRIADKNERKAAEFAAKHGKKSADGGAKSSSRGKTGGKSGVKKSGPKKGPGSKPSAKKGR